MNFIIGIIIGYALAKVSKNNKYRVYPRCGGGYAIEVKYWFMPIWMDAGLFSENTNIFNTRESAENYIGKLEK